MTRLEKLKFFHREWRIARDEYQRAALKQSEVATDIALLLGLDRKFSNADALPGLLEAQIGREIMRDTRAEKPISEEKAVGEENERVMRIKEVQAHVGLSRASIYDLMKKGIFPKQFKIGERTAGWLSSDIENWINSRILESTK